MKSFWRAKKVLVTGGAGFVGSYLSETLLNLGSAVSITSKSGDISNIWKIRKNISVHRGDLKDFSFAKRASRGKEIVLNLASRVAGIQYNVEHPALMFGENVEIAKNIIEASRLNSIERFLVVSSACVYPRYCTVPTPEKEGFLGDPEPTNLGYGWAKRVNELQGRFYNEEFGMKVAIARPYNAYGPRDNFDPQISHVIPGIIKRVFDWENPLVVWGSGKQTRSFIYVEDLVRGLISTVEKYSVADPVNIGSDEEISIEELANMIVELSGKKIKIKFDKTKPDGQPRRKSDTRKARKVLGFKTKVPLKDGLRSTIQWWEQHS